MDRIRLFLLCMPLAAGCCAAVYQWTDSSGTPQFSDQPPREAVQQLIERQDLDIAPQPSGVTRPVRSGESIKPSPAGTASRAKPHRAGRIAGKDEREQRRRRCANYQREIARTESQLRAGYSAHRGIVLNARLHATRDKYYHECR